MEGRKALAALLAFPLLSYNLRDLAQGKTFLEYRSPTHLDLKQLGTTIPGHWQVVGAQHWQNNPELWRGSVWQAALKDDRRLVFAADHGCFRA